jgi:hypothetical protein
MRLGFRVSPRVSDDTILHHVRERLALAFSESKQLSGRMLCRERPTVPPLI